MRGSGLRWEPASHPWPPDVWLGTSGTWLAAVVYPDVFARGGWSWKLQPGPPYVRGEADTPEAARAAAEAAWGEWCASAGLAPAGDASRSVDPAEEIQRIATVCGELSLDGRGIVQYRATFPPLPADPYAHPDTPVPAPEIVAVPPERVEGIFEAIWRRLSETPEYRPLAQAERERDRALLELNRVRRELDEAQAAVVDVGGWLPIGTVPEPIKQAGALIPCCWAGRDQWTTLVWKRNPRTGRSYFGDPYEMDDHEIADDQPTHWLAVPPLPAPDAGAAP